jgi:hypothetical protein
MLISDKLIQEMAELEVEVRRSKEPRPALQKLFQRFFEAVPDFQTISWLQYQYQEYEDEHPTAFYVASIEFNKNKFDADDYFDDENVTLSDIQRTHIHETHSMEGVTLFQHMVMIAGIIKNVAIELHKETGDAMVHVTRDGIHIDNYDPD